MAFVRAKNLGSGPSRECADPRMSNAEFEKHKIAHETGNLPDGLHYASKEELDELYRAILVAMGN